MGLHVIIGEDDYLVSEAAKKIVGDGTGLEVIDSLNATNAELQLADLREADLSFSTPPFLEPRKVTWWRRVGFLPQGGKGGPSEDVKAALERFAEKLARSRLPDGQEFVLSGPRLLATSVFAKTLKAVAEMQVFAAAKPWEAARAASARVADLAAEAGVAFAPGALEAFVARVGADARSLKGEFEKLRTYLGADARAISSADVAAVVSPGVGAEPAIWSVTDALGARDAAAAVASAREFARESGFAVMMTTMAERFFRQLAALKDAEAKGRFAAATEGMAPFAVRKQRGFLANWTLRELVVAERRFMRLRVRCVEVSAPADDLVLVELVRACRRARSL